MDNVNRKVKDSLTEVNFQVKESLGDAYCKVEESTGRNLWAKPIVVQKKYCAMSNV